MTFTRITIDPAVCTGKPCIGGLRFPVIEGSIITIDRDHVRRRRLPIG
ncbi:DUF433 domain-containing protein [Bradyrhizobium centrosematis]